MEFFIKNSNKHISDIARQIGYLIIDAKDREYNLVRKLTGNTFPRFHAYVTKINQNYRVSLHLDQKAPLYKGSHAHNGEYFGPVVEEEAERIQQILV